MRLAHSTPVLNRRTTDGLYWISGRGVLFVPDGRFRNDATMMIKLIGVFKKNMESFLLISAGAVIGANLRYWIQDWVAQRLGASFPYGTLIINVSGSLLLGLFMTVAVERFLIDPRLRLMMGLGVLSSYTTFSTYTYESLALIQAGQWLLGLFNLLGSVLLGVLAVALGVILGRLL